MKRILLSLALFLVALTPYDYPNLPKVKVLVVYRQNLRDLWEFLVKGGDYRVLDLRVGVAYLPADLQDLIRGWVNKGGGALVYAGADDDGDSASVFVKSEDVEYADLGRWTPVVLERVPMVNHPLLRGVQRVELYMHRLPDIENMQGKTPLLQTPDGRVVAFAMEYGAGRVVVLPTGPLLPYYPVDRYDNQRFFINIYQWLAGNPVPR